MPVKDQGLESDAAYQRGRADALADALSDALDQFSRAGNDATSPGIASGEDAAHDIPANPPGRRASSKADSPFRAYYNDACRKIAELERCLQTTRQTRQAPHETVAVLLERITLFVRQQGGYAYAIKPEQIADEIRQGQWRRVSTEQARASLVSDGKLAQATAIIDQEIVDLSQPNERDPRKHTKEGADDSQAG